MGFRKTVVEKTNREIADELAAEAVDFFVQARENVDQANAILENEFDANRELIKSLTETNEELAAKLVANSLVSSKLAEFIPEV